MTVIRDYKDLLVWQKARLLVKTIYDLSKAFPDYEKFSLTSQIRRASVSIPSNIAEGHSRGGKKDYLHFLNIAYGSAAELETQLLLSLDLGWIDQNTCETVCRDVNEIQKMLNGLRKNLRSTTDA